VSLRPILNRGTDKLSAGSKSPLLEGYLTRATWSLDSTLQSEGRSIKGLTTILVTPPPPATQSGQTVFLFPAFETSASAATKSILQPVLQWVPDIEGFPGWAVACYYVSGSSQNLQVRVRTKPVPVQEGDALPIEIRLIIKEKGVFGYYAEFSEIGGCGIYVETRDEFVQVGVALEVYGLMKLSDLPNVDYTRFPVLNIVLDNDKRVSPHWDIVNSVPQYKIKSVPIAHDGIEDEVDIFYR
jgi:hypothetical protein